MRKQKHYGKKTSLTTLKSISCVAAADTSEILQDVISRVFANIFFPSTHARFIQDFISQNVQNSVVEKKRKKNEPTTK